VALIGAPVARAAAGQILYEFDISNYLVSVPPQTDWVGLINQSWRGFYTSEPWTVTYQFQTVNSNYQTEAALPVTWNAPHPYVAPMIRTYGTAGYSVMTEMDMPGAVLEPGKQYEISILFRNPGHNESYRANWNTYSGSSYTGATGFFIDDPSTGLPFHFLDFSGGGYNGNTLWVSEWDEQAYGGIVSVGSVPVQLSYYSAMGVAGASTGNKPYLAAGMPLRITVTDVTPLSADTAAIIDAVERTGDRIIASQDRTTDAINNLANRLDPQDKAPLRDIAPREPESLPPIPTIPGPEAVLGADGVAAMQEIWAAFADSNFFKLIMVLAGVSIGIGIVTYLARRKKEE